MSCNCNLSKIDIYNLPDCPDVWGLISSGNTKGVFQIESPGGRHWAKKLQPDNIDLLSALIAIIRPGVLNALQDGKSMTDLFCERRHGAESKSINPNIDYILKPTFDILIYQEQMLQIAKELCDFSLIELDKLRKGAGKKDAKLMNELRGLFVSKAIDKGLVTEEKANEIYDIIEKSNKYSFNASHSFGYAHLTYITAYLKYHLPLEFYAAWIKNSQNSQDPQKELRELVQDARENGVEVLPPSVLFKEPNTHIHNNKIYLGLSDIKGVGEKAVEKLPDMSNMNWIDLLHNIKPKMLSCLIQAGALSHLSLSRKQMMAELNVWEQLTEKEKAHIKTNLITELTNGAKVKKLGGICHNENRVLTIKSLITTLTNSAYSTKDDPVVISRYETELLGINLTCSKSDYINKNMASCNLDDIRQGTKNGTLIAELKDVRIFKAKTGKTKGRFMAHVTLEDETGELPGVVFADQYEIYESLLIRGNMVMAKVFSKDFKSVFVNELWQA